MSVPEYQRGDRVPALPRAFTGFQVASIVGIALPPLAIAALGVSHPANLTDATDVWWHRLHVILIPLFPLLGVNLWWLLAGLRGWLPWLGRIAGFLYLCFYSALDILAGVAAGLVHERATDEGHTEFFGTLPWLFEAGNAAAVVGVWAFLLGCVIAGGLLFRRAGWRVVPGTLILFAAAISFLNSHIYFPRGVITMVAMALGFGLLQWARLRGTDAPTSADSSQSESLPVPA